MPGILQQGDQSHGMEGIEFFSPFFFLSLSLSPKKKHEKAVGDKAGRRGEGEGPVGSWVVQGVKP